MKLEFAVFAVPVVIALIQTFLAYYSLAEEKQARFRKLTFRGWAMFSLAVLIYVHSQDFYKLVANTETVSMLSVLQANAYLVGIMVLIGAGVFLIWHWRVQDNAQPNNGNT